MAEIYTRSGTWTFDGEVLRIVPGSDRSVNRLRQAIGELEVPLAAIAGLAFEPGRRGGRLRLRLRDGADPLARVLGGRVAPGADPYVLSVPRARAGTAEFLVEDVRNNRVIWEVPDGPTDRYLLPGPNVPVSAGAGDGAATFDGNRVDLTWTWLASSRKTEAGAQSFELDEIERVEWAPQAGMGYGYLRFWLIGDRRNPITPEEDPRCLSWGVQKEGGTTVLLGAAVTARLPHPSGSGAPSLAPDGAPDTLDAPRRPGIAARKAPTGDRPTGDAASDLAMTDGVLSRLRELGELHQSGVLTDEEFSAAKQALLRRLADD